MLKPSSSAREADSPVPNSTRPFETRSSVAIRSAMIVTGQHQHDAVSQPDPAGALGARGKEDLGRRGVGVLVEEVMLDFPRVVDAEPVGELDLFEGLVEEALLVAVAPRSRELMLIENSELHDVSLLGREIFAARPGKPRRVN